MPCTCGEFSCSPVLGCLTCFWDPCNYFLKTMLVFEVFAALVPSWRWVGHMCLDSTPLDLTWGCFHSFPQKDLLLHEIPRSTTSLCSRKTGVEKEMAKEICQKYLEKRAGRLPEAYAEALVTAACLCLRRRNASLAEVSLKLSPSLAMSPVCELALSGLITIPLPVPSPRSDFILQSHIWLQTAVSAGADSS